ncbi:hypothetical protein B0H63DRAFT_522586 [Podospora didyma]|uniref:Secreted protein n=1 Tax=Podospora didyma TaxID=330526 RepID=A0AAE0NPF9_9PEZI|nr:hypothetical protein B0H63DRAFT_522586 [Podospora didyma]
MRYTSITLAFLATVASVVSDSAVGADTSVMTAAQLCPLANTCGTHYWTPSNYNSLKVAGPVECGAACDKWTAEHPKLPCSAGSYETTTFMCYLKLNDMKANKLSQSNVITLIRRHVKLDGSDQLGPKKGAGACLGGDSDISS